MLPKLKATVLKTFYHKTTNGEGRVHRSTHFVLFINEIDVPISTSDSHIEFIVSREALLFRDDCVTFQDAWMVLFSNNSIAHLFSAGSATM